jgi:hypothetical protein
MVSDLVGPRWRHQRYELFQQFLGLEDHVGRTVAPAAPEAVEETPVGEPAQALGGHGRAADVATEALQAPTVPGRHGHAGVEAEPSARHAVGTAGLLLHLLQVDAVAAAKDFPAGAASGGDAVADRRCGQASQERLVVGKKLHRGIRAIRLDESLHLPGDAPQDALELVAVRWR